MANLHNFSWVRRLKSLNSVLLAILGITFIVGLNFLAASHFVRKDLTENARFSLAPETKAFLRNLDNPTKIIVTLTEAADKAIFNDVEGLLREYVYHSRQNGEEMLSVEYVDVFVQRGRAQALASEYGLNTENSFLVVSGERQKLINWTGLYARDEEGNITGFNGEQLFTSAIIEVSQEKRPKAYFLAGHGEMNIDSIDMIRGLSSLKDFLMERNFDLVGLDLTTVKSLPEDADFVVIAGPQAPFRPIEVEMLRNYLDNQGRLIVFLQPYVPHGLDDLFFEWGILADDRIIIDIGPDSEKPGGDMLIRQFSGTHPLTAHFIENQLSVFVGTPRPVRLNPGREEDDSLTITEIMGSSSQSWAERSYRVETQPEYSPGVDIPGPVPMAVVSERDVGSELGLSLQGGKLAVFGNADMISNGSLNYYPNQILASNIVNWAVGETEMLSIPPRSVQQYKLAVSESDLLKLLFWLMAVPLGVGIVGVIILLLRRI